MIFFMINGLAPPECREGHYLIPFEYMAAGSDKISEANVQLISWNEVRYALSPGGSENEVPINNVDGLKRAVFDAANRDALCKDINQQFSTQYGVNIFEIFNTTEHKYYKIIGSVFGSWPHPMIGNLKVSPRVRPQTVQKQYADNWGSFPDGYMKPETKSKINAMIENPAGAGLKVLEKSGRDQVRICKDMRELARAIMGEISTYATKKLEKIYALEMCSSVNLYAAQKELISQIINTRFTVKLAKPPALPDEFKDMDLKALFMKQREYYQKSPLSVMEYTPFYFPMVLRLDTDVKKNDEKQWTVFVELINTALEKDSGLKTVEVVPNLGEFISIFRRLPPVIRCAVVINDLKKLEMNYFLRRYSLAAKNNPYLYPDSRFIIDCHLTDASGRGFIPELFSDAEKKKKMVLWNWMREETHIATETYRHYLMPLWAGPSGHTVGIIEFYTRQLNSTFIFVEDKFTSVSSVIIATMFTFWRLYYDKRISAVHTLAETYEAVYSRGLGHSAEIGAESRAYINLRIEVEELWIRDIDQIEHARYTDPFDTTEFHEYKIVNFTGMLHSVRIMAQIKRTHYTNLDDLDKKIDALRAELAKNFDVPEWSKPIKTDPALVAGDYNDVFSGVKIRSFANLNVKTFGPPKIIKSKILRNTAPSERLVKLYEKIAGLTDYNFSEDFNNLPECVVDNKAEPFLSEISFGNIEQCALEETGLTFTAVAETGAKLWNGVKSIVPALKGTEKFVCTLTDGDDGFNFVGRIDINSSFGITSSLAPNIEAIIIKSGLDEKSALPHVCLAAYIPNGSDKFELTLILTQNLIYINGEYESGKTLTISKLLSLLGIDSVIPISSILPDAESFLGNIGLRNISMTIEADTLSISSIDFTVTTEKQWNIYDDKITFQPYFEINIEYPFDSKRRRTDYTALGKCTLGETVFEIIYRSDKVIILRLEQGSVLNFAKVAELFAKGVKFPAIKLTEMNITLDLVSKNFSLDLSATDVLKFNIGEAEIGIDDVCFSLDFEGGKFGDLLLSGTLFLGGISLNLEGKYSATDGFAFKTMAYSEGDFSLGSFAARIAEDISGSKFDPATVPGNLLGANIRTVCVSYESKNSSFIVAADIENLIEISDKFSISELALNVSSAKNSQLEFEIIARAYICKNAVSLAISKKNGEFIIAGSAVFESLTFGNVANDLGINTDNLPDFINEFSVTSLELMYNITKKAFKVTLATSMGTVSAEYGEARWSVSYKTSPSASVDVLSMPLVGELVKKVSPDISDFSVKDFEISASSVDGVKFKSVVFGNNCVIDIYKPVKLSKSYLTDMVSNPPTTVKWIEFNKTFAIVVIQKIGIGLDGSKAVLLLDASLNVSPFSFSLSGAGIGVNISNPSDIAFYLSGFGVAFDNGALAIGGSFSRFKREGKDVYSGSLLIKFKAITASAIGEYSSGSLMAYFALSASIGGPPAFFITGFALGFGYNKKLSLPQVENVPEFPLIKAAISGFDKQTLDKLNIYIKDEKNQNFLAAGVKFTSFKLVNGFLLLTVSFGKEFEIGALGIADISVPPNVTTNPIAKAQLALKAVFNMSEGIFRVEARLTSESYVLSLNCKLTGGFAAYFWFGNNRYSGDFVISLGGYHPAFKKPEHYPVVPRLGLNWNINKNLNISGEIYFALTPSTVMAGGKLSAVYTQGKLKAWFIAYADFLISWKPFRYDISIGVSIGASYRIDLWFIHKTVSIELSARLHIWGPEVQGTVHVSWFIISFTLSFSKGPDASKASMDWAQFKNSFLLNTTNVKDSNSNTDSGVLSVAIEGISGKASDGTDIVNSNTVIISVTSKIPESGNIRPVNSALFNAPLEINISGNDDIKYNERFIKNTVMQNVPAAMWKKAPASSSAILKEESVIKNAVCGASLKSDTFKPDLFPKTRYISLDELYRNNTLELKNCFKFIPDARLDISDEDSIIKFSENANSNDTIKRRQKFLSDYGITENVSLSLLAQNAENLFTENLLIS